MGVRKSRPTRMSSRRVTLPVSVWVRVDFLKKIMDAYDRDDVVMRAIKIVDQIMGPVAVEGSHVEIVHKDGTRDRVA